MPTPKNRNYLQGTNFKLNISRCPHVDFFVQSVATPDMRIGVTQQPTPYNIIKLPGDELNYTDLLIKFAIDEDLKNYNEIMQWMRFITNPSGEDFCSTEYIQKYGDDYHATLSLVTLNSHFNENCLFVFRDAFPVFLSGIMFDSGYSEGTDLYAECNFKVNIVDLYDKEGKPMWIQA